MSGVRWMSGVRFCTADVSEHFCDLGHWHWFRTTAIGDDVGDDVV